MNAIKHVSSGKCLNSKSGVKNPQNDELTILTDDCKSHQYY